jgi:Zn-dependent protease with chaperone function
VPAKIFLLGALGTALVIFAVSGWNIVQLSSGGKAVAEMVGARRVSPDTRDALERRLMNVVEEMSIASGVRVPGVYVMDGEAGINAFAAGYDVSDSIVAVTRGTLETLNRDELQGVVAHEFSHILNGDMRLNIRMIGVLAGIVFIGSIGEFIMRSQRGGSDSKGRCRYSSAGLALLLIGYIGSVFRAPHQGRGLAPARVPRRRLERAVHAQSGRHRGALDQIGASSAGALIANRHAEDVSHMFFGQGIEVKLSGLFDTHPPLEERIARVHSRFDREGYRKTGRSGRRRGGDGQKGNFEEPRRPPVPRRSRAAAGAAQTWAPAGASAGRQRATGRLDGRRQGGLRREAAAVAARGIARDAARSSGRARVWRAAFRAQGEVMQVQSTAVAPRLGALATGARARR